MRDPEKSLIRTSTFIVGMVISLVLILASAVTTTVESSRAQRDITDLFYQAERTTYLIGQISLRLAFVQITLLETVTEGDIDREEWLEKLTLIRADLDAYIQELPELLSVAERRKWEQLRPQMVRLRYDFALAEEAIDGGDFDQAGRLLDRALPRMAGVTDSLANLIGINQAETAQMLTDAERRLSLVRWMQGLIALALILGTALIWGGVIRRVRLQERQLLAYTAEIEESNNDLEAFSGRIAHDLRNMLAPLPMLAALLRGGRDNQEMVAEHMERTAERAVEFIDGLLTFSQAGGRRNKAAVSSLGEVIEACVEEQRSLTTRMKAAVEVDVAGDPLVQCPRELVHAVVMNVLNNALKFLEGCDRRVVQIRAGVDKGGADEGGDAWFEIDDSGPGIPDEELSRLFELFFRGKNRSAPGSGIGLSTVERIVTAYEGRIEVNSTLGSGTCFRITLPAATPRGGAESDGRRGSRNATATS